MVMQIKGKFIKNATLDSSKILLSAGQALRILAQDGSEKRLIELSAEGKVLVNGAEVALKSDVAGTTAAIESSLAAEVAARQAADEVLDGKITAEKNRAEAAEAALAADLAAETSARQSAVAAVQADLDAEKATRAAGDTSTLNSAKAYADQKVADLVNAAPAMLDTLKELADAIGNDASFATTIAGQVGQVAADLAAETARAEAAEAQLASDLAAETSARQAAISSVEASIASEATARAAAVTAEKNRAEAAEAGLQSSINSVAADLAAEVSRATGAEASITSSLNSEISRAQGAEAALSGRLDVIEGFGEGSVAKAKADANAYTDSKVATEKARAESAEASLAADIAAEASARAAAVSAEQARAEAAESALSGRVSTLEAKRSYKERFTLTQADIDNGFVEFAREAMVESVVAFVDRLAIHEGADQDYTMSVVAGKSRMTFVNNLIDPSPEKLSVGDVINVKYMA